MEAHSSVISSDGVEDEASTRPSSSRLSLGSSPSESSEMTGLNGPGYHDNVDEDVDFILGDVDEALTPLEKLPIEEGLFEDTSDTLSNSPNDMEDEVQPRQQQQTAESTVNVAAFAPVVVAVPPTSSAQDDTDGTIVTGSDDITDVPTASVTEAAVTTTATLPRKRPESPVIVEQEAWEARRIHRVMDTKKEKKEEDQKLPVYTETTEAFLPPAAVAAIVTDSELPAEEGREEEEKEEAGGRKGETKKEDQQQQTREDDNEYQKWHKEALDALTKIEIEFARLRDTMYREKMAELNQEALMIAQGTHPELVAMIERIEKKKNERIQTAEAWRQYKRINYQRQLDGLEYQANIDFIAGKNALRRTILESINRKRWNMESERDRLMDALTDADRIPDPDALLRRKRRKAEDTNELRNIAQTVGFPLAPRTEGIPPSSIEEDMAALGLLHVNRTPKQEFCHDVIENEPSRETASSCESSSVPDTYEHPIQSYQGHLYYYGRLFEKGELFTVVDTNAGRYSAKLLTSTDTEAVIQRTDGSKTRLAFAQMSAGKYRLFPKQS